jgi:prepilin-type processing-associated H-X9-DG protein
LGSNGNYNGFATTKGGPFGRWYGATVKQFIDGTSQTAVFAETLRGPSDGATTLTVVPVTSPYDLMVATNVANATWDAYPIPPWAAGVAVGGDAVPVPQCQNRSTPAWTYRGKQYYRSGVVTMFYTHTMTPNSPNRDCIRDVGLDRGHFATRSFHPGGANAVFADGSVRFVSNSVDLEVWRAAGTKAGKEATSLTF